MKIIFLALSNIETIEEAGIYTDLLRAFRDQGHAVTLVTPYERREGKETAYTLRHGIAYLHVKIGNIQQTNRYEKGISLLKLEHDYLRAIDTYLKDQQFDLILFTTPPITLERVVKKLKDRSPEALSYLLLKDIFPQNAVDLEYFSYRSPIYHFFKRKERRLYAQADRIGCMSPKNKAYLLSEHRSLEPSSIEVCPNTITPQELREIDLAETRRALGLPSGATVFLFGGNLGKPQAIPFLCDVLHAIRQDEEVFFLILGSGTEYDRLEHFIRVHALTNVKLLAHVPKSTYDEYVRASDVGLILLDHRFTIPNFPSRLLSYMEAAMPVLAATDVHTDLKDVLLDNELGLWCESREPEDFLAHVSRLKDESVRSRLGRNARRFLERHYASDVAVATILHHVKRGG